MTKQRTNEDFQLPVQTGIAADLIFSVPDTLGYLADRLLVHEEIVIPMNAAVLNRLEGDLNTPALLLLLKEKRIRFCPAYSLGHANRSGKIPYSREKFLTAVREEDVFKDAKDRNDLFAAIEETLVDSAVPDYSAWLPVMDKIDIAFENLRDQADYQFLFPQREPFYFRTGAITGAARMNDLITSGVSSMAMDQELPQLLEVCFPLIRAKGVSKEAVVFDGKKILSELHKISNLPTFETSHPGSFRQQREADEIIKAILSDEAHRLRAWLRENLAADLDVRAAYSSSEKLLPSKSKWTSWGRFGISTGVSTAIGMMVAGPLGAAAGAAVGALDLAGGEKLSTVLDGYHPKIWLSHIEGKGLLQKAND